MTPTAYSNICSTPVLAPRNPGAQPNPADIAAAVNAYTITEIHKKHEKEVKIYEEYQACDRLLVRLICAAVEDDYTAALKNEFTGYTGTTALKLLTHLIDTYANIDEYDLRENQKRMDQSYDPSQPIESLYRQIDEAVAYADAGKCPFTDRQIVNAAVSSVAASGVFADDVKEWRKKPTADQTLPNFKTFFSKAHREWRDTLRVTAGHHFPRVNAAPRTATAPRTQTAPPPTAHTQPPGDPDALAESLANLATATSTDRATVATLSDTVAKLSAELADTQAKLVTALLENSTLIKRLNGKGRGGGTSGGGGGTSGGGGGGGTGTAGGGGTGGTARTEISTDPIHYCWTCGYKSRHPSFLCPNPAQGHKRNATKRDTMNGSVKNKPTSE